MKQRKPNPNPYQRRNSSPEPEPEAPPVPSMADPANELVTLAQSVADAYKRLRDPSMAWIKQFERQKKALQEFWKEARPNQPFMLPDGTTVEFVQQAGKSKPVCMRADCGNLGRRNNPEWHLKVTESGPDAD